MNNQLMLSHNKNVLRQDIEDVFNLQNWLLYQLGHSRSLQHEHLYKAVNTLLTWFEDTENKSTPSETSTNTILQNFKCLCGCLWKKDLTQAPFVRTYAIDYLHGKHISDTDTPPCP